MRAALTVAAAALTLAACASPPPPVHQPTLQNLQLVRAANITPLALGTFTLAPGKPAKLDRSITVRAGVLPAPGGSFASYLKDTLAAELQAGGKLDPASGVVLSGLLTRSEVNSNLPTGSAALGATFTVTRDGKAVYTKELVATSEWPSQFIGAIAIPMAMDQYTALYPKLAGTLLADEEFKTAVGPN